MATSHSPQFLQFLSEESLAHASLVYRLPDQPDGRIKRIVEIPDARRVIKEQPMSGAARIELVRGHPGFYRRRGC